jgi:oligopeptidase A
MSQFIPFNTIDINYLTTQLEQKITNVHNIVAAIEASPISTWQTVVAPIHASLYELNFTWGIAEHLQSVKDSPELRELHEKYQPIITDLYVNLGQNQRLYQHTQAVKDQEYSKLNAEQQKVLDNDLRDFRLSGITLENDKQQEYKQIQTKTSELKTKFDHNVLDATDSYVKYVSLDELAGVHADSIAMYKAQAEQANADGYKITLHMPNYLPIMQYASNRELRRELYQAYVTRASELSMDGKFDNSPIIRQILELRSQKARLLDFKTYANYSLYTKMAETPEQVLDFLYQLAHKSRVYAEHDLNELRTFAQQLDGISELQAWDLAYYSEKLQEQKYSYSSNELKQYFPLPKAFIGLFGLIKQLYQVEFVANPTMPNWHADVSSYDVMQQGKLIGHIYFDLYAREGKQSGAWMNSAQNRNMDNGEARLPIAYIICNFTKPIGAKPSLLSFDDVQTLFHEMGHGLHHLLTTIDNSAIAGINGVEWDAVELPSQFMEYFTWDYAILRTITAHVDTGAELPEELFAKVLAARHYQSGLQMLRQLEFAIFDLKLHGEYNSNTTNYLQLLNQVRQEISVLQPPEYNRFANSFGHIFAGGYAAGYYSYKWAEVLACDVFSRFDGKSGSELSALGKQFCQTILSQGSLRPMMENFKTLMGREPQIEALIKYSGMN